MSLQSRAAVTIRRLAGVVLPASSSSLLSCRRSTASVVASSRARDGRTSGGVGSVLLPTWYAARRGWASVPAAPPSGMGMGSGYDPNALEEVNAQSALLKCIEKEIEDEKVRMDRDAPKVPVGWSITHAEGTSYFVMERRWNAEKHTVRVQLTQRDPSLDPECDIRGEHFPFTLVVEKPKAMRLAAGATATTMAPDANASPPAGDGKATTTTAAGGEAADDSVTLQLSMDVIEGELVVDNIRIVPTALMTPDALDSPQAENDRELLFAGPNLDEAEEEILDGVQTFLAERQFDDPFAEFIALYSAFVEQQEYERWLQELQLFVKA